MNSPTFWYKITVNIPEEQQDIAGTFFFQEGAVDLENRSDSLRTYFTTDFQIKEIVKSIRKSHSLFCRISKCHKEAKI